MKRLVTTIGTMVLLAIFISSVSFAAEAQRKYCRSGTDPVDTTYRLDEGEREVELSDDLLVLNKGKNSIAKCWLKKGDKVILTTADDGKEYIDRKISCNNPLLSPDKKKILWVEKAEAEKPKSPPQQSSPAPAVAAPEKSDSRPAVSLSANLLEVYKGKRVLLTWDSQKAKTVFINGTDMNSIMGSVQTNPITENTTFVATALAFDGQKTETTVAITAMDVPCQARKSGWGATIGGVIGSAITVGLIAGDVVTGGAIALLTPLPLATTMLGSYLDGDSKCVAPSDVNAGLAYGTGAVALGHVINHPKTPGPPGGKGEKGETGSTGPVNTTVPPHTHPPNTTPPPPTPPPVPPPPPPPTPPPVPPPPPPPTPPPVPPPPPPPPTPPPPTPPIPPGPALPPVIP